MKNIKVLCSIILFILCYFEIAVSENSVLFDNAKDIDSLLNKIKDRGEKTINATYFLGISRSKEIAYIKKRYSPLPDISYAIVIADFNNKIILESMHFGIGNYFTNGDGIGNYSWDDQRFSIYSYLEIKKEEITDIMKKYHIEAKRIDLGLKSKLQYKGTVVVKKEKMIDGLLGDYELSVEIILENRKYACIIKRDFIEKILALDLLAVIPGLSNDEIIAMIGTKHPGFEEESHYDVNYYTIPYLKTSP
jgi:hypothetical protein